LCGSASLAINGPFWQQVPAEAETTYHGNDVHRKIAAQRSDVSTWFDLLDLDDCVSFGGQP
jgi:hypothetical protein